MAPHDETYPFVPGWGIAHSLGANTVPPARFIMPPTYHCSMNTQLPAPGSEHITVTLRDQRALRCALVDAAVAPRLRRIAAVVLLLGLAVGVFGLLQGDPPGVALFWIVSALLALFAGAVLLLRRVAAKSVNQRMPLDTLLRVSTDASGVRIESAGGGTGEGAATLLSWGSLSGAERRGDVIAFFTDGGTPAYFAPGRALDDDALAAIHTRVQRARAPRGAAG